MPPRRGHTLIAAALGASLNPLNSTMIAVALPALGATFAAPPSQVTLLVVTGYLIATLVCQMPAGSIADRAGHMRALTWGRWNLHGAPCLDTLQLASLHLLAEQCERVWGPRLDIEWAVDHAGVLHLLQCRPITV